MYAILLVFHVVISLVLVIFILIQHGKGAQTGAAFGSGASQTVFGSQGSGGFISRTTGMLAAAFFALNLFLVYWINSQVPVQATSIMPATTQQHSAIPSDNILPQSETSPVAPKGADVPEVK